MSELRIPVGCYPTTDEEVGGLSSVELEGNTASNSFITEDGQERVDVEVTDFDSVDGAMSGYQEMRDFDFESTPDLAEGVEVASEGHLLDFEDRYVFFRDTNVIGQLLHVVIDGSSNPVRISRRLA